GAGAAMPAITLEAMLVPLALLWVASADGVFLAPWVAGVSAAIVGFLAWRRMLRGVRVGPPFVWLLGFFLWALISALAQPVSWDRAAQLAAIALFAGMLALIAAHPLGRRWMGVAVMAAGVLCALWLLVERVFLGGRPAGPFGNPNVAATVVVLAFAHSDLVQSRRSWVWLTLLLAGVLAAESRAAMLAVVVLCFLWLGLRLPRRWKALLLLGVVVAAWGLAWRMALDPDPLRFERLRIWKAALETAWDFAPWGTGPGGFGDAVLARNFPREGEFARFHRIPDLAESDLLHLAAALGVPGLVLAAGLVWSTFRAWAGRGLKALSPALTVVVTGLFHSQMLWPVLAFFAVSAGRFSGRWRLRFSPGPAFLLLWPLVGWAAAALPWPNGVVVPSLQERLLKVREVLRQEASSEQLGDALVEATAIARESPRSAEALRTVGLVQVRLARATGDASAAHAAIATFRRAQETNPKDVWAYYGEAEARVVLGQWEGARGAALRALALEPNCVPCWLTVAQSQLFLGMPEAARETYRKALAAERRARGYPFVSAYERALASPDPLLKLRLALALGEKP
ncbi:MAG: O-antigen ligase family protein, partial [Thermoanaerobaculum sp.]